MSKIKNDALDQYCAERFGRLIFVKIRKKRGNERFKPYTLTHLLLAVL